MQLSTFPIALAALLLAGRTTAAGCKAGTKYCGHTLYNMGWTYPNIYFGVRGDWPAQKAGYAIIDELFECQSDDKLKYASTCYKGCVDAGAGKSDYCN